MQKLSKKRGRKAREKWDRAHIITVSCRISRQDRALLGAQAARDGLTVYAATRRLLLAYIDGGIVL